MISRSLEDILVKWAPIPLYTDSSTIILPKTVTVYYGSKKVLNETSIIGSTGNSESNVLEGELPWKHFNPNLLKTGIFIDRFFGKWSYKDLVVKYDTSVENARSNYHAAAKLLFQLLKEMDSPRKVKKWEAIKKQIEKRSGFLPKGQRWNLLNKLLDLTPTKIAEFEGLPSSKPVYKAIKYTADRIATGELELFKPDPEKMAAAKARLEAKKAKNNAYRTMNIEKLRAKDRERYARKKEAINV